MLSTGNITLFLSNLNKIRFKSNNHKRQPRKYGILWLNGPYRDDGKIYNSYRTISLHFIAGLPKSICKLCHTPYSGVGEKYIWEHIFK